MTGEPVRSRPSRETLLRFGSRWAPPLVLCVVVVLGTRVLTERADRVVRISPLVAAVVVGMMIGNSSALSSKRGKDVRLLGKKLLRIGVSLLGFRLAIGDVRSLGAATLLCVVGVVVATFFGAQILAKALGLSPGLGLLVATGYSICGASAIAAMEPNADAEPEEVAYALSLVTLCGTLSIFSLPPIGHALSMSASTFGLFAGAAVHDVAQVVATSSSFAADAVRTAALVKLTRVVLLAPLVTMTSVRRRSQSGSVGALGSTSKKPPVVPLFVAGFLAAMAMRSLRVVPGSWLSPLKTADSLCLAAGMFAVGTGTSVRELRRLGGRPLMLGLAAWVLVAGVALALTLLTR